MKKVCVFLMFVSVVCGGVSSYATTDIAADAESSECVENITGTYSGDANFKAKWTPNNIQLNWYNNNTLMQGVNTESNTCNYDGALTIPTTAPERTGYIFAGWKVRPNFDFSTLARGGTNALSASLERWAIDYYDNNYRCIHGVGNDTTETSCTDSVFSDIERKEWKARFDTGMLYGSGYCSGKNGITSNSLWNTASSFSEYSDLESAVEEKKHCWCQATGWKPNGESTIYGQSSLSSASSWVYVATESRVDRCAYRCASSCAKATFNHNAFRRALFVGAGN